MDIGFKDTIYALATGSAKAGVAIIRISGNLAKKALTLLSQSEIPAARIATLRKLYHPKTKDLIDDALVIFFANPNSFTGEDVVEFHVHGSRAVINSVFESLSFIENCRMAEPGEFSKRAFVNNKMDLCQVEGLADVIAAETSVQLKLAQRYKSGQVSALYDNWRKVLIDILAFTEAYIDFPDEEIPQNIIFEINDKIAILVNEMLKFQNNYNGERIRNGFNIVIVGPVNAGKSSLLNMLANKDVAIVSEYAGTTRDIIEVKLDLKGYAVNVFDTAGLRGAVEYVEIEGIRRAIDKISDADLKLLVLPLDDKEIQLDLNKFLNEFNLVVDDKTIVILNKSDLSSDISQIIGNPNNNDVFANCYKYILTSFTKSKGVELLLHEITNFLDINFSNTEDMLICHHRHRLLISLAIESLNKFNLNKPVELAAEDLRNAARNIGKITGIINVEELLDKIFSSFCIGK